MSNIEYENTYKIFQDLGSNTSTPNNLVVYSRRPIHHNTSVSPITASDRNNLSSSSLLKRQQRAKSEDLSEDDQSENSCSDGDNNEQEGSSQSYLNESSPKSHLHQSSSCMSRNLSRQQSSKTHQPSQTVNEYRLYGCLGCLGIALFSALLYVNVISSENTVTPVNVITVKELKESFPKQSEEVWNAIETGIDEVKSFNKPSVFLLLYDHDTEQTLNFMLQKLSKYAVCILKDDCEIEPITLTRSILGKDKVGADYGYVIDKYKPQLEEKSVMIIKNLDKISGEMAQAFHSMCDEYTPLVSRAVFFFTVEIEHKSGRTNLQLVEEVLRNNWSCLDDDIFYPLFTRITSMVLRVIPEKT